LQRQAGLPHHVFVAGATGYLGRRLVGRLLERGHRVDALVRPASISRLPPGCTAVTGDALDARTFAGRVPPADTFVQLVGVPHPSPAKAAAFRAIDLVSARESIAAACAAGVRHFVYVSVAQPAPVMRAYIAVRAEAEAAIRDACLNATILRPWYVLGPGHRWPLALLPLYRVLERIPRTREGARRLALVTLDQMVAALVTAVETPVAGVRIVTADRIRAADLTAARARPESSP
jgi:uncharacterized protein YbjT (DUF2867 family)